MSNETQSKKLRVLIADYDECVAACISNILQDYGCEVICCQAYDEAVQLLPKFQPDVVLLHLSSLKLDDPVRSGLAIIACARKLSSTLPIIVFSASRREEEVRDLVIREGATTFLPMPFDLDELTGSIERGLTGTTGLAELFHIRQKPPP